MSIWGRLPGSKARHSVRLPSRLRAATLWSRESAATKATGVYEIAPGTHYSNWMPYTRTLNQALMCSRSPEAESNRMLLRAAALSHASGARSVLIQFF